MFALADQPTIFFKVSSMTLKAAPTETAPAFVAALAARVGAGSLLWGSDFSHTFDPPYPALVDLARAATAGLSSGGQQEVLAGTAGKLWPALAPVAP